MYNIPRIIFLSITQGLDKKSIYGWALKKGPRHIPVLLV
jgi:hypothetical protein